MTANRFSDRLRDLIRRCIRQVDASPPADLRTVWVARRLAANNRRRDALRDLCEQIDNVEASDPERARQLEARYFDRVRELNREADRIRTCR